MTQPRTRLRIRWADAWAMLGICAAVVVVVTALFYGYNL